MTTELLTPYDLGREARMRNINIDLNPFEHLLVDSTNSDDETLMHCDGCTFEIGWYDEDALSTSWSA